MKLARWSFHNVHIPMLENENGDLFCTSKTLCDALNLDSKALRELHRRHKEDFNTLSATENGAKEFLSENKVEFGIKRARGDMTIWTEDDMISVAMLSRSDTSKEFRRELVQFIKKNAVKGYVTKEQWDELKQQSAELQTQFSQLEELVRSAIPDLETTASAAGHALQAQKGTKHLRLVK